MGNFTKLFVELIRNWESDSAGFIVEGTTIFDDGNEEYVALVLNTFDENIYDSYDFYVAKVTKMIQEIIDAEMQEGDHAVTLEKVTYGNDSIIALITCCS